MGWVRRWAVAVMTLSLAGAAWSMAVPAQASAVVSVGPPALQVEGVELFPTATDAGFLGGAASATPGVTAEGYWVAHVEHTPDALAYGIDMSITGGTFRLAGTYTTDSAPPATQEVAITAAGMSGSVTSAGPVAGCPDATAADPLLVDYPANITLSGVTVDGVSYAPGATLDGTLTHYFINVSGFCVPVAATIEGTLSLVSPAAPTG